MAYYKNPITRYFLRKGFLRKISYRLSYYYRVLSKDLLTDFTILLSKRDVKVIIDAGANIGFMTFQFRKRFSQADVYCFEPNPNVFNVLVNNYKGDSRVHCFPYGVGDADREQAFNINANTGTSSFLDAADYHRSHQAINLLGSHVVQMISLDEFVKKNSIDRIDILKLDIEGYELMALQGAKSLLKDQKIDVIYTEVNIVGSYVGQVLFHDITGYLKEYGYHLFNLEGFVAQEAPIRQAILGNAVYFSENFREYLENQFGRENCGW